MYCIIITMTTFFIVELQPGTDAYCQALTTSAWYVFICIIRFLPHIPPKGLVF